MIHESIQNDIYCIIIFYVRTYKNYIEIILLFTIFIKNVQTFSFTFYISFTVYIEFQLIYIQNYHFLYA